jgi:membrane protein DedA with SNARE-associated domain/membrane-associated phospholipid phosphatase
MEQVQPYLDYFAANPGWAIAIVFLIAFGEALLIIGLFVPSTVVLVGAGTLVGTGQLDFWPVFLATATGAIAGDQVSYWAGRFFGERLKSMWPLSRYPQLLARGEIYVRQHGGKSIALGRFVPGVKAVVPGIVGMFRMNQLYFIIINFSSGLVWTAAHIVPGILVGKGLHLAGELSGRLAIVLLVLLAVLAVGSWLIRLIAAGVSPYFDNLLGRLSIWAKSFNSRPMRRLGRVLSPDHPRSYLTLLFLLFCVVGAGVLLDMIFGLVFSKAVSNLDVSVNNLLGELRSAPGDELMVVLTMIGDWPMISLVGVAMVGWLLARRAWRAGMAVAVFLFTAKGLELVIKYATARPRPIGGYALDLVGSHSFPSGHAVMSSVAFGMVAMLASQTLGRWSKALIAAMCGVLVIAIGFSRLYLGVHWMSDVLGGFLLGGILLAGFGVLIEALPARRIRPALFSAFMLVVLAGGSLVHLSLNFESKLASYSVPNPVRVLTLANYLANKNGEQTLRRVDLVGAGGEVFVGQWAGNIDRLGDIVREQGWDIKPKWTWHDGLNYLEIKSELKDLMPRPLLHVGLKAKLTAVKSFENSLTTRLVLRAYQTELIIQDGARHDRIYVLSLLEESLVPHPKVYALPKFEMASAVEVEKVMSAIQTAHGVEFLTDAEPNKILLLRPK